MRRIIIAILLAAALFSCNDVTTQNTNVGDPEQAGLESVNRALSGTNLARNATACSTDTNYNSSYNGNYAKDGNTTTKWCSTNATAQHWIKYNLGGLKNITGFRVRHAGSNGEMKAMNTKYFVVQFGTSDNVWNSSVSVDNSGQANITERTVSVQAQYVRMYISNCGIDNYARIYEFEVWGSNASITCAGCILGNRPDILNFYQSNGWNISQANWPNIINNWCGIDPTGCAQEKARCGSVCGVAPTAAPTRTPAPTASTANCAACIIGNRPDILNFYQSNGWNISQANWPNIINNWCGIDPTGCAQEKARCGSVCGSSPTNPPTTPPGSNGLRGLHWASDRALNQFNAGWNVESIIGVDNQGEIDRTRSRIQLAKSKGWQNIVRIDYQDYKAVPTNSGEYQTWTDKYNNIVNQLKGSCTLFIVGNEPTNEGQITPQEYIAAFNYLYARKPAGVGFLVAGPANFSNMNKGGYWTDYTWLRDVADNIGANDGFALHTYSSLSMPPYVADPRSNCACADVGNLGGSDCSFQRFRDYCALLRPRWSAKPVYITEWNTFGWGDNKSNQSQTPSGNYPGNNYMNNAYEAIRTYNQSNSPKIYALCWFVDNNYGGWENFALSGSNGRLPQAWNDWVNANTARGF